MPFAPGVASNPTGKNGKEFKAALMVAVKRAEGDKTVLAHIAEALVAKAMLGDVPAINVVADRLDGKPAQTIGGDPENPLQQVILIRWANQTEATLDPSKKLLSPTAPEMSGDPSTNPNPAGE